MPQKDPDPVQPSKPVLQPPKLGSSCCGYEIARRATADETLGSGEYAETTYLLDVGPGFGVALGLLETTLSVVYGPGETIEATITPPNVTTNLVAFRLGSGVVFRNCPQRLLA